MTDRPRSTGSMDAYDALSRAYDRLQSGPAADQLARTAAELVGIHGRTPPGCGDGRDGRRLLLDLGCGTGAFSRAMCAGGYDVIGIDASDGMLRKALETPAPDGESILYLQQDITRFELFGTVDAICCLMDTVNHVTVPAALQRMLRLCRMYLNPDGVFVFDIATRRHFASRLGNRDRFEDGNDTVLFWRNRFSRRSGLNTADLLLFCRNADGTWTRGDETIRERAYGRETLAKMLREAGFCAPLVIDARNGGPARPSSDRLFFICLPDPAR